MMPSLNPQPGSLAKFSSFLILLALALTLPGVALAKKNEGIINGTVTNLEGSPIAGVLVTVLSAENPDFKAEATGDKQGKFRVKIKKASGSYTIRLEGLGYETFESEVPLNAGDEQNITFKLVDETEGQQRDAVVAFNDGAKAFEAQDYTVAKQKFQQAIELNPNLAQAYLGLGDILYREQDFVAARAAVEKLLELDEENIQGRRLAFEVYRQLGEMDLAKATLSKVQDSDLAPKLAVQTYNEAVAALNRGEEDGAIERFQEALELNPELKEALAALGTLLYNKQRYDEAKEAVERLLELDPENKSALRTRFLIYDALNDQTQASAAMEAYQAADPNAAADILYRRADLDYRAGEVALAKKALLQVVEMRPDLARAHYTLGLCYIAEGNNAKAKQHLKTFLELDPDDSEASSAREMLSYL